MADGLRICGQVLMETRVGRLRVRGRTPLAASFGTIHCDCHCYVRAKCTEPFRPGRCRFYCTAQAICSGRLCMLPWFTRYTIPVCRGRSIFWRDVVSSARCSLWSARQRSFRSLVQRSVKPSPRSYGLRSSLGYGGRPSATQLARANMRSTFYCAL